MTRKDFISKSGAAALLTSLGVNSLTTSCSSEEDPAPDFLEIDLSISPFSVLKTDDAWLLHPTEDLLLVNVGGEIMVFSSVCPHTGCSRDWTYSSSQFTCQCHGSVFSNMGDLVSGPATRRLTSVSFINEGDTLKVG